MALKEESQGLFEKNGHEPFYCGMGQVNASFHTLKLINDLKPKRIINLGTAGSLSLNQGELVECTSFTQRLPNKTSPRLGPIIQVPAVTDLKQVRCGTGDYIEQNNCLVECDVMDMEAYAMAVICEKMQIPFTSIKYITDNSNENFRQDWKRHLQASAEKLLAKYITIL